MWLHWSSLPTAPYSAELLALHSRCDTAPHSYLQGCAERPLEIRSPLALPLLSRYQAVMSEGRAMQYNRLGNTGLKVWNESVGCMNAAMRAEALHE